MVAMLCNSQFARSTDATDSRVAECGNCDSWRNNGLDLLGKVVRKALLDISCCIYDYIRVYMQRIGISSRHASCQDRYVHLPESNGPSNASPNCQQRHCTRIHPIACLHQSHKVQGMHRKQSAPHAPARTWQSCHCQYVGFPHHTSDG